MRINPVGVTAAWQPPQLRGAGTAPSGGAGEIQPAGLHAPGKATAPGQGQDFRNSLAGALRQVNELQLQAEDLARALAAGQAQDLHQVMLAAEKANLSLQFTLQIRNKVIEAYQEIMRIQV